MENRKRTKFKIIKNLILGIVILGCIILIGSQRSISKKFFIGGVVSGSMTPAIKPGDLIISWPQNQYEIGDIITFKDPQNPKGTITHRLVAKKENLFQTKGDQNETPDSILISQNQILGKVVFKMPLVGYLIYFLNTTIGFILLIVIPATIIIYDEILFLKKEWQKYRKERRRKSEKNN